VTVKDGLGWTLLHNAAYNGDMDMVLSSLELSAKVYEPSIRGRGTLEPSVECKSL